MAGQLITDSARRPVLAMIAVGVAVVVVLAAVVWHGTTTAFDTWAFRRAYLDFGGANSRRRTGWLLFSEPVLAFGVPALVLAWGVWRRRWDVAVLAVAGPLLALGVTEVLGKPLVGRVLGPGVLFGSTEGSVRGSYPSGHETAMTSWLMVLLIVGFSVTSSTRLRVTGVVVAVLWTLAGAVGLTVNYYHYATDTVGAMGVSAAVVPSVALAIDLVTGRVSSPGGRDRSRTARAA